MNITMAEVLQELETAVRSRGTKDGYHTVLEIMEMAGWGQNRVRQTLMAAKKEGRLSVSTADRENLAGRMNPVTVYKILPAKKGKKR